ncbi:MAG: LCP family protein [Actinobacteria bacterium]|nr:LCP family protein [Actinomycetota bacterium]
MAERISGRGSVARALVGVTATLALLVGLVTAGLTVQWVGLRGIGTDDIFHPVGPSGSPTPAQTGPCADQACNYLLLGSDSRAGLSPEQQEQFGTDESIGGATRADTIMLVHTDPRLQKAIVLSFPRDLWVAIPGRGHDRINTAFEGGLRRGGAQVVAQTVANLTGLKIDHFLYVDLEGFRRTVTTLGGVDMCIPAYNVNTPGDLTGTGPDGEPILVHYDEVGHIADPNSGLNIEPGCQRLDGDQALAYVRARHLPCDHIPDFARIGRQQQFLRAVVNQMLQPSMVVKAPALVGPVLKNLRRDADLLPSDLVYLVGQLRGLSTGAVEFRTVPGVAAQEGTKAVLRMDPSAHEIFRAIRQGRPIGDVGTQLVNTPPSEANTRVAVVDADSEGTAPAVESVLSDAGFDVTPGIWSVSEAPIDVTGPAIVFRPEASAEAQVVAAYFPDLTLVASEDLRGAQVAIVVDATYSLVRPGEGGGNGGTGECPAVR